MVDRYAIDVVNSIGHGAFGKIFECKITNQFYEYLRSNGISMPLDTLGTLFAVKIQNYETLFQGQLSLLREIDVLMRTKNYPGTVEIFDFYLCDETKQAYLILRLAQTSLDGYIRSETDPFRRVAFLPFFNAQMLLHLGYLKHNSIAHRDIKPQNILLQSAPHIFGWTVDKSLVDACSTNRFYSIEKVYLENYCGNPIQQLCRHFQPMGQNCNCFISETENSGAPPPIRFGLYEKPTNENSFQKPVPERTEKPGTQAIPIKTLKKIDRVGSCPARNLFDSSDAMDEDVVTVSQRGEQQEEPLFPLNAKTEKKIRRDQRTMHFAYLCDFGLSKHMNKTHHSPYIVTPNFRAPELFDPVSFSTEDDDNPTQDQLFAARGAIRQNKLRSSLLLSTQNSTNSPSSSDPNDVSLKREEDLAYNESIDIWGLGCTLAQLVTGKPLFPGKNLQSVYTAIKGLLSGTSFVQAPQQIHRENNNDDRLFRLDEERGFVNAFGEESDEQIWQQEAQENTMWITSVSKRTERIRQRIFLQLLSNNEPSAQRVCDMLGNDFFDMLAHMLDPNPQTRLDAEQLFAHKFVEAYVQPTLTLIFAISTEKPSRFPPIQFSKRSDHHWWAFQHGLRAGSFEKNQLLPFKFPHEHQVIFTQRCLIFDYMLEIVRQTKCRYQTLFSALYHFDRCVANFAREEAQTVLLNADNYNLLAVCCIYLTVRYYERIFISTEALLQHLKLIVGKLKLEKYMALFLDTIGGQLTLPSPWHFVLLSFNELLILRKQEFATVTSYKNVLTSLFGHTLKVTGSHLQRKKRVKKSKEREQLFDSLKSISAANNLLFAENLRADARMPNRIYTSHFKKHCSRLLLLIMKDMRAPYIAHNNRALGKLVFNKCLFNGLFIASFEKLQLKHDYSMFARSTVTLVKARYN